MPQRSRLSRSDFVDAAIALADRDGLDALTLRAIGSHLEVDSTAIYRHFPSKEVLLVAILDRYLHEAFESSPGDTAPRGRIESVSHTLRGVLMEHPPLTAAVGSIEDYAGTAPRFLDMTVDSLEAMGLDGEDLVAHYQLLENFVIGSTYFDVHGAPNNWEQRRARFARVASRPFRTACRTDEDVRNVSDKAFSTGLRLILDSCEAAALPQPV